MDFPDQIHLRKLQEYLGHWPKSRAALLVGAGFSLNAEPLPGATKAFPNWRGLVEAMYDQLHPPSTSQTFAQKQSRKERFLGTDSLRIASEYEAIFGSNSLAQLIKSNVPDLNYVPGNLHKKLLQLPWRDVFTTNYDTLLERTEVPGLPYTPVCSIDQLINSIAPRIIKLHGSFSSRSKLIITEEDFRKYPKEYAPFVNTVQQSLIENAFVLIGFSSHDPNFLAWIGWIRDELKENHAPIYLVGKLSLSSGERALLLKRGITPIDLSPVFQKGHALFNNHPAYLDWFLDCLDYARPIPPLNWPRFEKVNRFERTEKEPPLIGETVTAPPEQNPDSPHTLTDELFQGQLERWRFERKHYPGWLAAPKSKRTAVWDGTKGWIDALLRYIADKPIVDRILLYSEINWRLEVAMVPLFENWLTPFREATAQFERTLLDGGLLEPSIHGLEGYSQNDVINAWFEVSLGLLREARETLNTSYWSDLKSQIEIVSKKYMFLSDRFNYEQALFSIWNLNLEEAKRVLAGWQLSDRKPLFKIWKASLLAELGEFSEARILLREALKEIRSVTQATGQDIHLLSLEGWCTHLIYLVETALDPINLRKAIREFSSIWKDLETCECNPWEIRDEFSVDLKSSHESEWKPIREQRGFDPGSRTITRSLISSSVDSILPAYGYIRLFEQVGIPFYLRYFNTPGDELLTACRWIAPGVGFASPALLIRSRNQKNVTAVGSLFDRRRVASMSKEKVYELHNWCLEIWKRETTGNNSPSLYNEDKMDLLCCLIEVLSRLTLKLDENELQSDFNIANAFLVFAFKNYHALFEAVFNWFKRLFEVASSDLILRWLPTLIRAPLFDEIQYPDRELWPEPLASFPSSRLRNVIYLKKSADISEAVNWLIELAKQDLGGKLKSAILRLKILEKMKLLDKNQRSEFSHILWKSVKAGELPEINWHKLLTLPSPAGIIPVEIMRNQILRMNPMEGFSNGGYPQPLPDFIFQSALVTNSPFQPSKPGYLVWDKESAKLLFSKTLSWWNEAKNSFRRDAIFEPRMDIAGDRLAFFLASVALQYAPFESTNEFDDFIVWSEELREKRFYISPSFPQLFLNQFSNNNLIESKILFDLEDNNALALVAAIDAVENWIRLVEEKKCSISYSKAIDTIIERIIFRQKVAIKQVIDRASRIVAFQPQLLSMAQINLLAAGLKSWDSVTQVIPTEDDTTEFDKDERPELRRAVALLAGTISAWWEINEHSEVSLPAQIQQWHHLCQVDGLPEVNRAFSDGKELLLELSTEKISRLGEDFSKLETSQNIPN